MRSAVFILLEDKRFERCTPNRYAIPRQNASAKIRKERADGIEDADLRGIGNAPVGL